MAQTGIVVGDYLQVLDDLKRTVGFEQVTKTIDPISGTETVSYAASTDISVVFFRNDEKYEFDKEGIIDVGDAYILVDTTQEIKREDKITIDSQTFIIQKIIRRHMTDIQLFDYCVMILLE